MHEIKENTEIPIRHARILRGPTQLAFDITNKCNLNCLHCFNRSNENSKVSDELSDREVINFIKDVIKMKPHNICICGGEPTLRFNLLCQISRMLSSNGIMVSLVTNGLSMTSEKALLLKESGVERIQVSLDGATDKTHETLRIAKGSFNKAIEAIKIFKEMKIKEVGVAFTPTKFNCEELEKIFELCKSLGVNIFRVQPLMILGRARSNVENILPSEFQYRNLVRKINELKYYNKEPIIQWGDPIDHLIRFRTTAQHMVSFLTIQANGDIVVSPYLPISVGNIRKNSIIKYWEKGLPRIWENDFVKNIASRIMCISDFGKEHKGLPIVWFDENIRYDLIKDKVFS